MVSLNKRTVSNCLTPTWTGQRQKERLLRGHSPGHGLLRKCHKLRLCQSLGTYLDAGESLSLHAVGPGTLEQTQSLSNLDLPSYENIFPRDISLVLLHPGSKVQDLVLSHGFSSDGLLFPGVVSTAAFPNMDSSTLDDSTNGYENPVPKPKYGSSHGGKYLFNKSRFQCGFRSRSEPQRNHFHCIKV
jgi:hypothetical protein